VHRHYWGALETCLFGDVPRSTYLRLYDNVAILGSIPTQNLKQPLELSAVRTERMSVIFLYEVKTLRINRDHKTPPSRESA
jgi:hypothetical protein